MATITFNGRLTADPLQREAVQGNVTNFTVASNTSRKGQDGNYLTNFFRVDVWGRRGDFVMQYFHKGDPIAISGELIARQYQDRNGQERTSLEVNAASVEFVPQNKRQQAPQQQNYQQQAPQGQYQQPQQQQYQQAPQQNYQQPAQQQYQQAPQTPQQAPQRPQSQPMNNQPQQGQQAPYAQPVANNGGQTQVDPKDLPF